MQLTGKWFGFGLDVNYDDAVRALEQGNLLRAAELFVLAADSPDRSIQKLALMQQGECLQKAARVCFEKGEWAQARALFAGALAVNPAFPDLHFGYAQALAAEGNYVEAADSYRKALELNPVYAEASLQLGAVLLASGQSGESHIEDAFRINPNLKEKSQQAVARLRSGDRVAINDLRGVVPEKSRDANLLAQQADILVEEADYEAAVEVFRKALALAPRYPDIRCRLGQCLLQIDKVEEAESEFRYALEVNPRYVEAWAQLGIALKRRGRDEEALTAFQKANELDPFHIIAAQEVRRHSWR